MKGAFDEGMKKAVLRDIIILPYIRNERNEKGCFKENHYVTLYRE